MKEFLDFLSKTPTAFHAAEEIKKSLQAHGFQALNEKDSWKLTPGGKYFVGRNMSSLIAFVLPKNREKGYRITASHLDSPTFKIKPKAEVVRSSGTKLNVEVYGGPIFQSWMDRPLGIAGRVLVEKGSKVEAKLVNISSPALIIPNLPIHYNRNVNSGIEWNPQTDLLPFFSENPNKSFKNWLAEQCHLEEKDILNWDLYLTVLDRGMLAGAESEYIVAPQIDNLECSFGILQALLSVEEHPYINVAAFFDNEEIGSSTMQGAAGTFLDNVLERISLSLGQSKEEYLRELSHSFFVSCDNAQGFHSAHPEKYDEGNACYLNKGIVIKNAARGSYSTDAFSGAFFQEICKKAGVSVQLNSNRSDIAGGSTLGVVSLRQVSIPSVDIGLAQLAMHSAYETAGSKDLQDLITALKEYYTNSMHYPLENQLDLE